MGAAASLIVFTFRTDVAVHYCDPRRNASFWHSGTLVRILLVLFVPLACIGILLEAGILLEGLHQLTAGVNLTIYCFSVACSLKAIFALIEWTGLMNKRFLPRVRDEVCI